MNSFYTSRIEISKSALEHNIRFLRDFLRDDVRFCSVVKGNAYGHGIELFVPLAEECGVGQFAVFSADEAFRVKNAGKPSAEIMIMGMLDDAQLEWAIEEGVSFYVFDQNRLERALEYSQKLNKPARLHVEVETGMNRTGFSSKELPGVMALLQKYPQYLRFEGLCTHYAGAESIANYYRVKKQQGRYAKLAKQFKKEGLNPEIKHTACSAASMRYPKTQMDLVRIGILQYGFFPSREVMIDYLTKTKRTDYPLERIISWKSQVMDVKTVKTGEFVGYGTSYLANSDLKIATVPVGYSHGFSRSLSNQGRVLIRGQRMSVVGTVNMNMMSVDVTSMDNVEKGDEVVLIGRQGDLELSVSSFGEFSDQVNYELLTRLPSGIPRMVVE